MSRSESSTVDVRDMLCAQALAVVSAAVARAAGGMTVRALYNAEDVKRDLLVWAHEAGHRAREVAGSALDIERGSTGPQA